MKFKQFLNITAATLFIMFIAITVNANPEQWAKEGRETFEVACWSLEAAIEFATAVDYNRCFIFAEKFGFEPWGFLTKFRGFDTGMTIYSVEWGNGAPGVYAVK